MLKFVEGTPAQQRAALLRSRRRLQALLDRVEGVRPLELRESDPLPEPFASLWRGFIRLDHPVGDHRSPLADDEDRKEWIMDSPVGQSFPLRCSLVFPLVTAVVEALTPVWLLDLYEIVVPFDLILLLKGEVGMVAFSDDEDGLRRLVVRVGG